eukprot:CAMPEP_0177641364 /NCGR_PEP_ID=MMETSP0447-20121125/7026_1 /TAXON_ID=0 /ORGANISM="Stygamoeba regulata, Strain BSH-02190019" /LENGTH=617 /DNA_ID=CAMNT_0019143475 /DNA_START=168 /DNA_END=2021 /DNA_ORIENTATION=+
MGQQRTAPRATSAPVLSVLLAMSALCVVCVCAGGPPQSVVAVDCRASTSSSSAGGCDSPTALAVQACAGLMNRTPNNTLARAIGGACYVLNDDADSDWLDNLEIVPIKTLRPKDFLSACLSNGQVVKGYIKYNYTAQQKILPNLLTLAAVLDAVPLEEALVRALTPPGGGAAAGPQQPQHPQQPQQPPPPLIFDAVEKFDGWSAHDVTAYMLATHAHACTTLAMMNPGYDTTHAARAWEPPFTLAPNLALGDYVVKARLFAFYMVNACIVGTKEHALMKQIAADKTWSRPVRVFGYNDAWFVAGGFLFEAQTTCVPGHNLGAVASAGTSNLSFFSLAPPPAAPLAPNPDPHVPFNASRTYVALIVGDGDNLEYLQHTRMQWMRDRVGRCAADAATCFPLVWSISGHPLYVAPPWLQWYYAQARATGRDYFTLPPMGYVMSYPSMFPADVQAAAVAALEEQARMLAVDTTVSWEWFYDWARGFSHYYPRYGAAGLVRGVFAVNVPFMLPVLEFGRESYKVLHGAAHPVVMFRPREWRGSNSTGAPPLSKANYLTPTEMAAELNTDPRGTVTHIYLTSDGGASLDTLYDMVGALDEHVSIVSTHQLVDLALQRSATGVQ